MTDFTDPNLSPETRAEWARQAAHDTAELLEVEIRFRWLWIGLGAVVGSLATALLMLQVTA